jgi:hypothetical protein
MIQENETGLSLLANYDSEEEPEQKKTNPEVNNNSKTGILGKNVLPPLPSFIGEDEQIHEEKKRKVERELKEVEMELKEDQENPEKQEIAPKQQLKNVRMLPPQLW